jgi:hypothetical protein
MSTIDKVKLIASIAVLILAAASCVAVPIISIHYRDRCEAAGGSWRTLGHDLRGLCITPDGRLINP